MDGPRTVGRQGLRHVGTGLPAAVQDRSAQRAKALDSMARPCCTPTLPVRRRLAPTRNCYDRSFRGACDIYNAPWKRPCGSLQTTNLRPGTTKTIHTQPAPGTSLRAPRRRWRPEDFDHFEFVSDYEMKGLKNQYQTHGLGVPLIVVRRSYQGEPDAARYYPPDSSFPVTAFLRPMPAADRRTGGHAGASGTYDPLEISDTCVGNLQVPLESDLTTPLAYFLSKVPMESLATAGLFRPEQLLACSPATSRR